MTTDELAHLYRSERDYWRSYASNFVPSFELDDLVQTVALQLCEQRTSIRQETAKGLAMAILKRRIIDYRRQFSHPAKVSPDALRHWARLDSVEALRTVAERPAHRWFGAAHDRFELEECFQKARLTPRQAAYVHGVFHGPDTARQLAVQFGVHEADIHARRREVARKVRQVMLASVLWLCTAVMANAETFWVDWTEPSTVVEINADGTVTLDATGKPIEHPLTDLAGTALYRKLTNEKDWTFVRLLEASGPTGGATRSDSLDLPLKPQDTWTIWVKLCAMRAGGMMTPDAQCWIGKKLRKGKP